MTAGGDCQRVWLRLMERRPASESQSVRDRGVGECREGELHLAQLVHHDEGGRGRAAGIARRTTSPWTSRRDDPRSTADPNVRERAASAVECFEREADALTGLAQLAGEKAGHHESVRAQELDEPGDRGRRVWPGAGRQRNGRGDPGGPVTFSVRSCP